MYYYSAFLHITLYAQNFENETHKILWNIEIRTDHSVPPRRPVLVLNINTKKACYIVDFAVSTDHKVKVKEVKNVDKHVDFAREDKKLWNMKVTVISILVEALGTFPPNLEKGLDDLKVREKAETMLMTPLLKSSQMGRKLL